MFIVAVLRRIQIFCTGFAISAACVVLAGLMSAHPNATATVVADFIAVVAEDQFASAE